MLAASVNGHIPDKSRNVAQFSRRHPFVDPGTFASATNRGSLVDHPDYTVRQLTSMLGYSVLPALSKRREIQLPYQDVSTIYACIRVRARAARKIRLRIFPGDPEETPDLKPLTSKDPLVAKLKRPNRNMTWGQLIDASLVHMDLSGENFWFLMDWAGLPVKFGELPRQIVPVNGDCVEAVRNPTTGQVQAWRYTTQATSQLEFPVHAVVRFSEYDPSDPMRGMGKTEVAIRNATIAFQTERYLEGTSRAGGPGAFLNWKKVVTPNEESRMRAEVDDKLNRTEDVGKLKLLTGEWDIKPNPADPKRMESVDTLKYVREVICSVFGVPPPCIGVFEQATYNNVDTAWRQLYLAVWDELGSFAEQITAQLFQVLGAQYANCTAAFDSAGIDQLKRDDSALYDKAAQIASRGAPISFFEACTQLGVDTSKLSASAKTILVPASMTTLDLVINPPEPEPAPAVAPAKDVAPEKAIAPLALERVKGRHPPLNAEERRAYHASLTVRVVAPGERRFKAAALGWLEDYESTLLRRLRLFAEHGTDLAPDKAIRALDVNDPAEVQNFLLLAEERWADLLLEATGQPRSAVFAAALADQASELGVPQIAMKDPRVLLELSAQNIQLVEGVASTTAAIVKETLLEALAEVETLGSLQEKVKENLPELEESLRRVFKTKDQRAQTIARTEVGHAVSTARFMQMKDAGITRHQWVASEDSAVRESHSDRDGKIVSIGDEFAPGLLYPKDSNGGASEVINCRCEALAIVED